MRSLFERRMPRVIRIALAAFLLLFAQCSSTDFLNAGISRKGYSIRRNIAYGALPRQRLDVYQPTHVADGAPVVLFFYGGSWQKGSKDDYLFVGQALAEHGVTAVLADYRLYPEVYFPDFVRDGAAAVRWVHNTIEQYGGSSQNVFIAGHSAGAHIAMLLAADTQYLKAEGGGVSWLRGVIGLAGPYDFLPFRDAKIAAVFSKFPEAQSQPIHFLRRAMPPVFMAVGLDDTLVLPRNSQRVAHALRTMGHAPVLRQYPGIGHVGLVLSLAQGFRWRSPVLADMLAFIDQHTNPNPVPKAKR
jgi:acetyl esterase/lipase